MNGTWTVSSDLVISISVTNSTNNDVEVYYDSPVQLKITDIKGFGDGKKNNFKLFFH